MAEEEPPIKLINTNHGGNCLSCEEYIHSGEQVNWTPGVGIWHAKCPKPRNLKLHYKQAQKQKELGL